MFARRSKPYSFFLSKQAANFYWYLKRTKHILFKKIGIVVDPLHFDVCTVFSSSMLDDGISLGLLLLKVETFPPLLIRLLFGPTMFAKSTLGGGVVFIVPS